MTAFAQPIPFKDSTSCSLNARDQALRLRLHSATEANPDYWSFRKNAIRQHAHAFFQYPAMMVPQLLARLLADVQTAWPGAKNAFDPFVGSGTVTTETMLRGMNFHGQDINPLAILLCRMKAGPLFIDPINARTELVLGRLACDKSMKLEVKFENWQKWFRRDVAIALSKIVRSIRSLEECWSRRFYWVALAETVRLTSNSRTSTFKLHVRPEKERLEREIDPIKLFHEIVRTNTQHLEKLRSLLADMKLLRQGRYTGTVTTTLGDSAKIIAGSPHADILLTSPPYGDNTSTVPYGQHSYLPLKWIDLEDIDSDVDKSLLASTHALDSRSLGGSRKNALTGVQECLDRSSTLRNVLGGLPSDKEDCKKKVAAFFRDLDASLPAILSHVRLNGYMFWIVGDRRVADRLVPLHTILSDLLQSRGSVLVTKVEREIPSKRMATRNNVSSTMRKETILVLRKAE